MNVESIKNKILEVGKIVFSTNIGELSYLNPDKIKGWDSLKHIEFVFGLEEAFGITFSESEIQLLVDHNILLELVKDKLNQKTK